MTTIEENFVPIVPADDGQSTAVETDAVSEPRLLTPGSANKETESEMRRGLQASASGTQPQPSLSDEAVATIRELRRTTHHVKAVPESEAIRERIKAAADEYVGTLRPSSAFTRGRLERWSRELLRQLDLPEKFLGFAAVMLGNAFWRRRFLAIPFERRMLLLPHCLKHSDGCPAEYHEYGLGCETCGACSISGFKSRAEELGYKVLVAEGSPIVLKIIVSGHVDGILGVACLNVLEKALDKVLYAGVPSYAVPLRSSNCNSTSLDESWIWEVLDKYEPLPDVRVTGYLPLIRTANDLFDKDFERLLPRTRDGAGQQTSPWIAKTEEIAYDWLARGGKRFRPFITLAAYSALDGCNPRSVVPTDGASVSAYPDAVCRVAMAIEAFHKASLVHDDIEDNDLYRYGRETLHRRYDLNTAINVGDYLIGLGYRLVNSAGRELGAEIACDILDRMAAAHVKLCDGQGAEMSWQASPSLDISPLDALQIYALKTAPAFEAALYAGLRMAGPAQQYEQTVTAFARHIGVGFQILNDLKDWEGDHNNKLVAGQDAAALRPTILLALAMQSTDGRRRQELDELFQGHDQSAVRVDCLRRLFSDSGAFDKARSLVEKSRLRAQALADAVEPEELRQLLHFLIDTVLSSEECSQRGWNTQTSSF